MISGGHKKERISNIPYSRDISFAVSKHYQRVILIWSNKIVFSKYIVFSAFKFPHIILSLLFAILICYKKSLFKKYIFLYVYLFLSFLLIFLIYLSSTNIEFMVSTGSLRLMFEFSAPYLLFIVVFFKERFKSQKRCITKGIFRNYGYYR